MLHWALVFLVIALIAAVFGFGGVYVAAVRNSEDSILRLLWCC